MCWSLMCVRIEIDQLLLSNDSLLVGQLYEDKSLALHACDLISTIDNQTVNYYCQNNSLLGLIYFLNMIFSWNSPMTQQNR